MDAFNKRLGPLPVYGWALIVAAALLLRHASHRNRGYITSAATFNTPALQFDSAGNVMNSGAVSNGGGMHLGKGQLGPLVVTPPLGQDN